ncbi:uncharacterized protein COLE_05893 [Cutaneotrichosporon oleaginosum]|uniref:uncharacterized protein n=1 Tax=Cutaneotrichosporon oleaginosum TaxID=879819 RepID=UPI001323A9E8|nr:hypothetical protein COLE_05893 [Cutaneotrichosporon oleaginosum]
MTSCGHIYCDDQTHNHRSGVCTFCNRPNITVYELGDTMPSPLHSWFQPTQDVMRQAEGNVNVMKFQYEQLMRLARSQRQKMLEDKGLLEQVSLAMRSVKEDNAKNKQAAEELSRQCREMRAQRDTAIAQRDTVMKQNETLCAELAAIKASVNRRTLQPQLSYDDPLMNAPMVESPFKRNVFDVATADNRSRKRPYGMGPGDEMDPFHQSKAARELRHRPGTTGPPLYRDESESMHSGPAYVAQAPLRVRSAAPYDGAAVRNNLDQFRYRREPTSGPMPLAQHHRPSFTLADPTRRQRRPHSAQQRYTSQTLNTFPGPTHVDLMDTIPEMGEESE